MPHIVNDTNHNTSSATTRVDDSNIIISNGYYTTRNIGDIGTWATIGASLATPDYKVVCVKNTPLCRPYYRLKLFLGQLPDNIKEEYRKTIVEHNKVIDLYKKDKKVCFDAGFDLFVPSQCRAKAHMIHKLDHMIQCSMDLVSTNNQYINSIDPVGYFLYPRSSMATRTPLLLANSAGIIDSGYRGNIIGVVHCGRAHNHHGLNAIQDFNILSGQRLMQICPPNLSYPLEVVEVDNEDKLGSGCKRGKNGFGSTGV